MGLNFGKKGVYGIIMLMIMGCGCISTPDASKSPSPTYEAVYTVDRPWDEYEPFRAGLIDSARSMVDQLSEATVYHIEVAISEDCLHLQGREEIRYTNQEDTPLAEIYFRLFPNIKGGTMTVSRVTVDGEVREPSYESRKSAVCVPLSTPLQPGSTIIIGMNFEVEVAQEKGANYGLFGYFEDVLALDEFYPLIPVYDDGEWNVEVPPPYGDVTYNDASFYLVQVTAPERLILVASGIETDRTVDDGTQVVTFAAGPARDFYLAASEYFTVVKSTGVGDTTINSYTLPGTEERADMALRYASDALETYNDRVGTYPYTEFDIVAISMLAYGMEYPGIIAISTHLYTPELDRGGASEETLLEITLAHEVAHQWFYNVVGNDQVDHPWLDEAVVQYCTGLYYLDTQGEAAAEEYRHWSWSSLWNGVNSVEIPIGLPVGSYTGEEYGPIVYGRGPFFVEALADEMGQEAFDAFLREYHDSNRWEIGTAEEFRELAEKHCQCDLTTLFEEWVYEKE